MSKNLPSLQPIAVSPLFCKGVNPFPSWREFSFPDMQCDHEAQNPEGVWIFWFFSRVLNQDWRLAASLGADAGWMKGWKMSRMNCCQFERYKSIRPMIHLVWKNIDKVMKNNCSVLPITFNRSTVEHCYNKVLGTSQITLLQQLPCIISDRTQGKKSSDQNFSLLYP